MESVRAAPTGPTTCPECGGAVRVSGGEAVCQDCGLVVGENRIDHGPDWLAFGEDRSDSKRVGAPLTEGRHDRGLSTEIGWKVDANGNQLSGSKRSQMGRLRQAHNRARFGSTAERNLAHGFTEIRRVIAALGLGESVREQAWSIFRSAQNEDLIMGRSIEGMAAASVYAACRCSGAVRALDEVVSVAQVGRDRVKQCYNCLNTGLGLATLVQRPSDYVAKVATEVDAPDEVERQALEMARSVDDTELVSGFQPSGVAAACLFLAGEEHSGWIPSLQSIAEAANVTEQTVRSRRYDLEDREGGKR